MEEYDDSVVSMYMNMLLSFVIGAVGFLVIYVILRTEYPELDAMTTFLMTAVGWYPVAFWIGYKIGQM